MQKYGLRANDEQAAQKKVVCLVCDDPQPVYAWSDYSGEGYCLRCGTPYQLKWGELREGESYPRINVKPAAIPLLRRYFAEYSQPWGGGTFMDYRDYPEVLHARKQFNAWWEQHKHEYPELADAK